ncbi:uncharacterized protein LAESUDRAFT_229871 [Laetiporus sulphureus 93-53]|uniref:Uncharacterized protein n=1 Tax=Laetiporus sulphureus 93-53 TaxID=1314785 RepID=A0A165DQK8_9APHY|nr:uncharacterized protein LAESUDRAFT_229871 [Laetiporus sulphureus 93-53]KZT05409.1 hypothetical protein LAESUDRAFT_229871 [Laetiporus sulphureus 93-53]
MASIAVCLVLASAPPDHLSPSATILVRDLCSASVLKSNRPHPAPPVHDARIQHHRAPHLRDDLLAQGLLHPLWHGERRRRAGHNRRHVARKGHPPLLSC